MRTREAAIEQGRAAASRGEWQQAYRLLLEADDHETLAGDDLVLLATAAYGAGDLDGTIQAWERAYTRSLRAGDRASAVGAASRVAMHLLVDTGLMVRVRIWIHRAERLLDPHEPTPIHAWLAVLRSYERLFSGDFAEARRCSREAMAMAARCDPGAAAVGRPLTELGAAWQAARAAPAAEDLAREGGSGVGRRVRPTPVVEVGRARGAPALREVGTLEREGEYWSLTFDGHTVRVRDVKGMRYLAALLAAPGREIHVLDLVAAERGRTVDRDGAADAPEPVTSRGDAGAILDRRAKEAYRRRLAEIEEEIITARVVSDMAREAQADTERDFLIRELSRAVGLGGRDRRTGSPSERARVSVTRALRSTLARIRAHDAWLADHLDRSIRTGTYCAYLPDPRAPAVWWIGGRAERP